MLARDNEVEGVSSSQQMLCIIPFVLGLIFRLFQSSELGSRWAAEPSCHVVAGISGNGILLGFGERRMFQSRFAFLQC